MVFPGRFSTGCIRCRQRKVKCDEKKPSCRRCYMYGKPCPGYTDQFQFRHKSAKSGGNGLSSSSSSRRKSSGCPVTSEPAEDNASSNQASAETASAFRCLARAYQSRVGIVAARNPEQSLEHIALCYFVRRFVSPTSEDSIPGHMTFLPDLFNGHEHGILEVATLCVAQAAAYTQLGGETFRLQSYRSYGRAIKMLQQTIQSEDKVNDDRDITGEGRGIAAEHASGLYYLIEKRGVEQLATRRGFEAFLIALIRLNIYAFHHNDISYLDPGGLATLLGPYDPLMQAMAMMSRTLRVRHALSQDVATSDNQEDVKVKIDPSSGIPENHVKLVQECFETLAAFDQWDAEAAAYWRETFRGRALHIELGAPGYRFDQETACILILVRSARLVHLLTLLEYLERHRVTQLGLDEDCAASTEGRDTAWTNCLRTLESSVRTTIDDMLTSVPYALGDVVDGEEASPPSSSSSSSTTYDGAGGLIILHPIRLITYSAYATPEQLRESIVILDRINKAIGIRSAISWEEEMASCAPGEGYAGLWGVAKRSASPDDVLQHTPHWQD